MDFRSVRFRLTFWYVVALAVILTASGFYWHQSFSRKLQTLQDEKLLVVAQDAALAEESCGLEGDEALSCGVLEELCRSRNWHQFVQFRSPGGELSCHTGNLRLEGGLPLSEAAKEHARRGIPFFESIEIPSLGALRVVTYPIMEEKRLLRILQVVESQSLMEEALDELELVLLTFMPLALLILGLGGWFIAGRSLSPVAQITGTVRRINAENLSQRLDPLQSSDEIAELVDTFNSMLSRLEESFNKIRQFTADASHEMRTPLAILKGETEVALRWAKDPEELRRTLESNMEEIDRMTRIIEDLLALAKSEAGEIPLDLTRFGLSDLLQDLYMLGRTLAEPKGIEFSLNLDVSEDVLLRGDQLQLHRAILNLISNSVKYTPDNGQVCVELSLQGDEAVVAVRDTGIGIDKAHLPHLFDRFYRVDEARNRQVGGTGLGLSIVRWIIDAHEGRIEVDSTPGKGSTFTVFLPLEGPRRPANQVL